MHRALFDTTLGEWDLHGLRVGDQLATVKEELTAGDSGPRELGLRHVLVPEVHNVAYKVADGLLVGLEAELHSDLEQILGPYVADPLRVN